MGALYQNVCYPSEVEARKQVCASVDVKTMDTTNLYTTECTSTVYTTADMSLCKRTNGGNCTTQSQPWPVTPACAHDGGISLATDWFYASITLVCIVWGGRKLIKLFDYNTIDT